MQINIFYQIEMPFYYKKTSLYKKAVLQALGTQKKKFEQINIVIVSEDTILQMNKDFLGHNYITDVITFETPSLINNKICADIFVCFEQTKRQAIDLGRGIRVEFLTTIIHGILHLVGYNDDTIEKRNKMNAVAESIAENNLKTLK